MTPSPNEALLEARCMIELLQMRCRNQKLIDAANELIERLDHIRCTAEKVPALSQPPASSPPETLAQKQAREVMSPGFGSAVAAPGGQSYNASASSPAVERCEFNYGGAQCQREKGHRGTCITSAPSLSPYRVSLQARYSQG